MNKHAPNAVARLRAHQNRITLAVLAGAVIVTSAAIAGTVFVTNGAAPALLVVSEYDPQSADKEIILDAPSLPIPKAGGTKHALEPKQVEVSQAPVQKEEIRWFNNRPIRPARTMSMLVTAYSPDERSCGKWADGITASGYSVWTNGMKSVAADTSILPFGSLVSIPGYDNENVVPVLDRGGAIRGNRLDVLYPTHERALQWGVQRLEVTIWEYADGKPNGFRQNHRRR